MGFGARVIGTAVVKHKLSALPGKLQKSITRQAQGKAGKVAVKAIRNELSTPAVRDVLKILVKPNRKARAKAKTEKGQVGAAARLSASEMKRSIGIRKFPRSRMRDKNIIFHAIGPRSGFKVTNIRSASKRIPLAATSVAKMIEQGTTNSRPSAFMRRVMQSVRGPYQDAMLAAARELIAKAGA